MPVLHFHVWSLRRPAPRCRIARKSMGCISTYQRRARDFGIGILRNPRPDHGVLNNLLSGKQAAFIVVQGVAGRQTRPCLGGHTRDLVAASSTMLPEPERESPLPERCMCRRGREPRYTVRAGCRRGGARWRCSASCRAPAARCSRSAGPTGAIRIACVPGSPAPSTCSRQQRLALRLCSVVQGRDRLNPWHAANTATVLTAQ
jgi:hypothetical protein